MSLLSLLKKRCNKALFTTPSHSQQLFICHKLRNLYKLDISETDFYNPEAGLAESEKFAANVYGTVKTKYLTNGSSSGIIASVLSCVKEREKVLIWENSHPCHKNAITLAGAEPVFYSIETDKEWGIPTKVNPKMIEKHLQSDKDIRAVIITSPTYEGIVSDVKLIKKICLKYGVYLIVDEAHGALYPFSDKLPESSVKIADFTVQSLHKTAGGLNPTALVHTNTNLDIDKALKMISTTSPSYPLLASIEANIRFLNSEKGKKHLNSLLNNLLDLRKSCPNCNFGGDDITKILIKHNKMSGFELSELLYDKYNIEDEKTNEVSTMLLCGIGTSRAKILRLQKVLKSIFN